MHGEYTEEGGAEKVNGLCMQTFGSGGTMELFDDEADQDVLVTDATDVGLAERLQAVLQGGTVRSIYLSKRITNAGEKWRVWQEEVASNLTNYLHVIPSWPPCQAPFLSLVSRHSPLSTSFQGFRGVLDLGNRKFSPKTIVNFISTPIGVFQCPWNLY